MKYQIWNGADNIITPDGRIWTPEQWKVSHPMCAIEGAKFIIGGGFFNGAMLYEFTSMVERYEKLGCDFSDCTIDEEYLAKMEEFEDEQEAAAANAVSTEERIAAALELQALQAMPDIEETE